MTEIELKRLLNDYNSTERSRIIKETPISWEDILSTLKAITEKEKGDYIVVYVKKLMNVPGAPKDALSEFFGNVENPMYLASLFNSIHGISLDKVLNRFDEQAEVFESGKVFYAFAYERNIEVKNLLDGLKFKGSAPTKTYKECGLISHHLYADWLMEMAPLEDARLTVIMNEWRTRRTITDLEYFEAFARKTIRTVLERLGDSISKTNDIESIACFACDFPKAVKAPLMTRLVESNSITAIIEVLSYYTELYTSQKENGDADAMLETFNRMQELTDVIEKSGWLKDFLELAEIIGNINNIAAKRMDFKKPDDKK